MQKKSIIEHLPLIIGIALPLLFIAIAISISSLSVSAIKPAHDFIYAQDSGLSYGGNFMYDYSVSGSTIVREQMIDSSQLPHERVVREAPQLFLYDIETNTTKEISFDEAKALMLAAGPSSPDGYMVDFRYQGSFGFFGGGGSESGYFITKGDAGKRLPGLSGMRGYGDLRVIGWVVSQ